MFFFTIYIYVLVNSFNLTNFQTLILPVKDYSINLVKFSHTLSYWHTTTLSVSNRSACSSSDTSSSELSGSSSWMRKSAKDA